MTRIKVFSTPACSYCITLKEFLKEHKVEFEDVDVAEDLSARKEMIQKSNQMGVPVVEIDGQIIVGFDKEKISEILKLKD